MTKMLAVQRQEQIVQWVQVAGTVSIEEMVERFAVSHMTIHRDLEALQAEGHLQKVRGGATLSRPREPQKPEARQAVCAECGKPVSSRSGWVITSEEGERRHACCAHCGLLSLRHQPGACSALAADFLYGQMVNVFQATFVIGSDVALCCVPSVLCFATREDAERFQTGFRGRVLAFAEVLAAVSDSHHHHNHH